MIYTNRSIMDKKNKKRKYSYLDLISPGIQISSVKKIQKSKIGANILTYTSRDFHFEISKIKGKRFPVLAIRRVRGHLRYEVWAMTDFEYGLMLLGNAFSDIFTCTFQHMKRVGVAADAQTDAIYDLAEKMKNIDGGLK